MLAPSTRQRFRIAAIGCMLASSCLGSWACSQPTLWLGGTALPVDSGVASTDAQAEPNPVPSEPSESTEPGAAGGAGDTSMPSARAQSPKASAAGSEAKPDAGAAGSLSPGQPGNSATRPPATSPRTPAVDSDAGTDAEDTAPTPAHLPSDTTRCPMLNGSGTYTFGNPATRTLSVQVYIAKDARAKPAPGGPLILYFHGLGSDASEVLSGLGQAAIDSVIAEGGVVAAFSSKLCASCGLPDDVAWYMEDDAVSDHVVACALAQARIDPRRIHSLGFSSGALHSLHLALARSSYIASVVSFSGGASDVERDQPQDPKNPVSAMLVFGNVELDVFALNFNMLSIEWYRKYTPLGWYTMLCDHGGGHVLPRDIGPHAYRFLRDHPYKVDPKPYAGGIPTSFPTYCKNEPPMR